MVINLPETAEQHKLRALRITAAARFAASARLRRHETSSLFSITMCSLAVVIISLLEPFGVQLSLPDNAVNLFTAATSLLILVVSLMVSGHRYGERAEKMHSCGIGINAVAKRFELAMQNGNKYLMNSLSDEYEIILKMYENHIDVDYRVAQIKRYREYYNIGIPGRIVCWLKVRLDVLPHLIPLIIVSAICCVLVMNAKLG